MTDQDTKVTSPKEWKQAKAGRPLKVPSGNTALVRRPGIEVFMKMGIIPNSLLEVVQKGLSAGKKEDKAAFDQAFEGLGQDPQKLQDMFKLVDAVTVYCVIEPVVSEAPGKDEPRDSEKLYVDEVDFDDKMFIFQWAIGGTQDLESFRQGLPASVGDIPGIENLVDKTEQPTSP